jgi:hypothetical protein
VVSVPTRHKGVGIAKRHRDDHEISVPRVLCLAGLSGNRRA